MSQWFQSTTDKWIVHAVIQDRVWKVNGQENLLECGDIRAEQMLRLSASGPTTLIIMMAYKVGVSSQFCALFAIFLQKLQCGADLSSGFCLSLRPLRIAEPLVMKFSASDRNCHYAEARFHVGVRCAFWGSSVGAFAGCKLGWKSRRPLSVILLCVLCEQDGEIAICNFLLF